MDRTVAFPNECDGVVGAPHQLGRYFDLLGTCSVIDVGGQATLSCWKSGTGPPVVLLHGLLGTALHWSLVAPMLAEQFAVYVPELIFGGHSTAAGEAVDVSVGGQAALVAGLLETLDLHDVCVVGNDTGATIVQILAVNFPTRLGAAVISDGDAFENLPPAVFKYLCWLARFPRVLTASFRLMSIKPILRSPIAHGWLSKRPIPPPIVHHYLRLFRRSETRGDLVRFLRGVNNAPTLGIAKRFGEIRFPTLIAWSKQDRVFPVAHAQRLTEAIPGARLVLCDDSYAYLPFDQPNWLSDQIMSFMSSNLATDQRSSPR